MTAPIQSKDLSADIVRGTVQLHKAARGRGPRRTHAEIGEQHVLVVSDDAATTFERSLIEFGKADGVIAQRVAYYAGMSERFVELIERETGRTVETFIHGPSTDATKLVELYLLQPDHAESATTGDLPSAAPDRAS